jgi:hypothetical protein
VAQALPQVPQLAASVWRFLQVPEHMLWPVMQTQAPAVQVRLFAAEQAVVQVPQWLMSVCRFTQAPEQALVPVAQVVEHVPFEQT